MFASSAFSLEWIVADLNRTLNPDSDKPSIHICLGGPPKEALADKKSVTVRLGFEAGYKPKEWVYDAGPTTVYQTMQTGQPDPRKLTPSQIVRNYGAMVRHVMDTQRPQVIVIEINNDENDGSLVGRAIMIALMQPSIFAHQDNDTFYRGPDTVYLCPTWTDDRLNPGFVHALESGLYLGRLGNGMRRLAAHPLNVLNMERFTELILWSMGDRQGVETEKLSEEEVRRMGCLMAVCAGSRRKPYVIRLQIDPIEGATEDVDVDIFKCLVFDDGGPNHKGTAHIDKMQTDMAAGAMGLMKFHWLAEHRKVLKRSAVGLFMIAENRIGSGSYMHGDVLTAYDGRTVEVHNTDAEGRLVLADGIAYARDTYKKIRRLTTNATLTSAVITALGEERSGLMVRDNSRKILDRFEDVGDAQADLMHRLIVDRVDSGWMDGIMADVKNVSGKPMRGSQTAGAFLWNFLFTPGTPDEVVEADTTEVVHIDMARVCIGTSSAQADGIPLHGALWWQIAAHQIEFEPDLNDDETRPG